MFLENINIHYINEATLKIFVEHFCIKVTFTSEINSLLCFHTENKEILRQRILET